MLARKPTDGWTKLKKRAGEKGSQCQKQIESFTGGFWLANKPRNVGISQSWLNLHAYYLAHDGDTTEIDFEVLHSYFDVERFLQQILRNPKYTEHHIQAFRLLEALEGFIDDLIKQGYRQAYPDIYKSFEDEYLDEDERFQNKNDP